MSGGRVAWKDLALELLKTADEAWSGVYDAIRDRVDQDVDEPPIRPQPASLQEQVADLRIRIGLVNEAWNAHQKKHLELDLNRTEVAERMWVEIKRLQHLVSQEPPKAPTLIEKLEIQNLQYTAKDMALEIQILRKRLTELERKEAERGASGSGTGVQQIRVPADDNVQSVRIWCQTSGAGCDSARDWLAKGDGAATCQAGPDPRVEVGGPAAVQPGSGEHVPAADGGDQPAGGG